MPLGRIGTVARFPGEHSDIIVAIEGRVAVMARREFAEPPTEFDMHLGRERLIAKKQHLMFDERPVQRIDDFVDLCVAPAQCGVEVETAHFSAERRRPALHHEILHRPSVLPLSITR